MTDTKKTTGTEQSENTGLDSVKQKKEPLRMDDLGGDKLLGKDKPGIESAIPGTITLTQEQLTKLVADQVAAVVGPMTEMMKGVGEMVKNMKTPVQQTQIYSVNERRRRMNLGTMASGVDDQLEKPATFYNNVTSLVLTSERRGSRIEKAPFDSIIKFEQFQRFQKDLGNGRSIFCNVSKFTTNSKAVAVWIRESNYYGVNIFEESQKITNGDPTLQTMTAQIVTALSEYDDKKIRSICESNNILYEGRKAAIQKLSVSLANKVVNKAVQITSGLVADKSADHEFIQTMQEASA